MRFLQEWSSVRHFLSIEYSNSFGDTEKTQGLVGETPSRCADQRSLLQGDPSFRSLRRWGAFQNDFGCAFGENPVLRAWPSLIVVSFTPSFRFRDPGRRDETYGFGHRTRSYDGA